MPYVFALFLAAHAFIHTSYLTPRPATNGGPQWPFDMADSWAVVNIGVDVGIVRIVGVVLIAITIVCYLGAALAAAGLAIPGSWFAPLVVVGSVASILVLGLFFHPWIVLGIAIDLALVYAVAVAGWHPSTIVAR